MTNNVYVCVYRLPTNVYAVVIGKTLGDNKDAGRRVKRGAEIKHVSDDKVGRT